jgi:hypothetical protein
MRKQFTSLFEYKNVEYEYSVILYAGEDACVYPDRIVDLERVDGQPLEDNWEEAEAFALANARLVEWCEDEGWAEEYTDNGFSALVKRDRAGGITRIMRADRPIAPQFMAEPIVLGSYDDNEELTCDIQTFRGGINEWIADHSVSRWSTYTDRITKAAGRLGRGNVNPRWIEAFMLLENPAPGSLSEDEFNLEVTRAINCMDFAGPGRAEHFAKKLGL